jgi:hypothetical protein
VDTVATAVPIRILGVNAPEEAGGNAGMVAGRVLAWLQDQKPPDAWHLWQADYRDVIVVDDENKVVSIYNLTIHNLADSTSYAELRTILLSAAGPAALTRTGARPRRR